MARPTLANPTDAERASFERRRQESAIRCPDECCIMPDGYPPEMDRKFSIPDGTDQDSQTTYTQVYQCPECKEIMAVQ
jgi:Zn finger protein HypA/HybF involved in hydrogenase expression